MQRLQQLLSLFKHEKTHSVLTTLAILIGGISLAAFLDSKWIAIILVILTIVFAGSYAILARKGKLISYSTVHQIAVFFFMWSLGSVLFGLRSLQIVSLPFIVVLGALLAYAGAYIWRFRTDDTGRAISYLHALTNLEWFAILLFAPGSFMVLGALYAIAFGVTALLFDLHDQSEIHYRDFVHPILIGLAIAFIFILGFTWSL
ncbi:MAG: hypothetical protein NT003_04570 [Candidatus Magasanikbacteria bacterium]|nr:hypothetical protein [Candidatus Magasanikbacteria bacterium]